jgi:hypothetical protein
MVRKMAERPVGGTSPIRVIYIMGCGRSGSTVLDTLLGNHGQVISVGELAGLNQAVLAQEYCSCRTHIHQCAFWGRVLEQWQQRAGMDLSHYVALQKRYEQAQMLGAASWLRLWRGRRRGHPPEFRDYLDATCQLYQAIAEVAGRRVVVESSKAPVRAAVLSHIRGIDLRLIHLVRDVRGVAWSRKKSFTPAPEAGVTRHQPGRGVLYSTVYWLLVNLVAGQVRAARSPHSLLVRYEDLVTRTEEVLDAISAMAEVDFRQLTVAIRNHQQLAVSHLFAGNRVRMSGSIRLQPDVEWQQQMPQLDQRITAITAHWTLKHYGYVRKKAA